MSLAAIIAGVAAKVGAELVGKALGDGFGTSGGSLADTVIDAIAGKAGKPATELPSLPAKELEAAVKATEADMPELISLWAKGLDGQFALLESESQEGLIQSAWRWGWMYLLGVFWIAYVLVFPVLAMLGHPVEGIDVAVLLTLTTWFISLYMGGHTVKALGESAIAAVRSWRG